MEKIITMSKIGYNAPSGANWCYNIWKIDLIETGQKYCMSYTVKETFGGDYRIRAKMEELGYNIIETKGVYTGTGTPKITGIAKMMNIEGDELLEILRKFVGDKIKTA